MNHLFTFDFNSYQLVVSLISSIGLTPQKYTLIYAEVNCRYL